MKKQWYFTFKSVPEISDLNKKERIKIWRKYCLKGLLHWQTWCAFALYMLWVLLVFFLTDGISDYFPNVNRIIFAVFYATFGFGVGFYFFKSVWIKMVRPYIKKR
jgi:signal transduction histidine kinase